MERSRADGPTVGQYDATMADFPPQVEPAQTAEVAATDDGFDDLDLTWLRSKPGAKWAAVGDGVLPSWVADMDFPVARPIGQALQLLAAGGDLGYPAGNQAKLIEETWAARMAARYGWAPRPGRARVFTDLVQVAQLLLHVGTSPGDGVLLLTPSYPPFVEAIEGTGRRLLAVPAIETGAGWEFDLDKAEALAKQAKVLFVVNPHNPTGRMLSRPELARLGDLAMRHDLVVISDEIHADLTLVDRQHVPFASLSDDLERRTITLYSASKAYNLGGMCCAVAHFGTPLMDRRLSELPSHLTGRVSVAAMTTTLAAWSAGGDAWLERCVSRLRANRKMLGQWLNGAGGEAGVKGPLPEATYLSWFDFRATGLGDDPAGWLVKSARVRLSEGLAFGPGGAGFARVNFATTPSVLGEILSRIAAALEERAAVPAGPNRRSGERSLPPELAASG
ncbi:MAG TPA: aminotransferase class I/II-fold pyridoxal phosphate-dependent enzyme [Acidimicrobiales bacterium]|nr:aminotransferase class I/II-fold pyridoxal phosphate-dependent enzyme [Acidimicrobiales bacterium]